VIRKRGELETGKLIPERHSAQARLKTVQSAPGE
jgi:hypothetical protein